MKKLLAIVVLGLAGCLPNTPVFAFEPQRTAEKVDWAAVGGRDVFLGARAEVETKSVAHRRYSSAFDAVYPPPGFGGSELIYAPGGAPYASRGGATLDFQLEGR